MAVGDRRTGSEDSDGPLYPPEITSAAALFLLSLSVSSVHNRDAYQCSAAGAGRLDRTNGFTACGERYERRRSCDKRKLGLDQDRRDKLNCGAAKVSYHAVKRGAQLISADKLQPLSLNLLCPSPLQLLCSALPVALIQCESASTWRYHRQAEVETMSFLLDPSQARPRILVINPNSTDVSVDPAGVRVHQLIPGLLRGHAEDNTAG